MNKRLGNVIKFGIFLGLGVLLIWLATRHLTPEEQQTIRESFRNANYWWLLPSLIIGIISHLTRALRWRLLMLPMGYQPSVTNTFCAVMIGYLANLALPRMGEITRCGVLAKYGKIPAGKLIGTMIAERGFDVLSLLLLLFFTIIIQLDRVGDFFYSRLLVNLQDKFSRLTGARIALLVIILILLIAFIYFSIKKFRHTKIYQKISEIIRGVWEGILTIRTMKNKGLFLVYTLLIWICYFLMVYIGFFCLGDTAHLGIKAGLAVLAFGSIGMVATQGGIGAYQLIVQKTLVLYNVGEAVAYAFGWIIWLAQTLLVVVVGFICLLLLPVINHTKLEKS